MGLNGGGMGLGFTLWAHDMASHVLKRVEQHVKSLDATAALGSEHIVGSFTRIARSATVLAAGLAPVGAAVASAFAAADFTQGLAAVGAATNATTRQMQALHDTALAAGIATQFSPTEAVQGLISLATAGQTATQSMQTLKQSLDLAAASLGQLTVSQASDAVVGTLNSYAWSADRATEVTDKLVQTTMLTNFQARDFAVGLSRAAEAGARYSQSLDDVLIGMGILRNRNFSAEVASTALRSALIRVNSDLNAQGLLLRAGVPLLDAYTGKERSILDVLTQFASVTRGMNPLRLNAMVKDIFGDEGMPAFSAIATATFTAIENGTSVTYQGAEAIAALRRELAQAGGAAGRFVERYNDNFKGQIVLLRGSVSALFVLVGEVFGELLKPAVAFVTRQLNHLLDLITALPMPFKKAMGGAILAAGGFVALAGAISLASAAMGFLNIALVATGALLAPVFAAVGALATPVGLAILGVATALGTLATAYRMNIGGMADLAGTGPGHHILTFWRGLSQILETGTLRGEVLKDLNAEPAIKRFTVGVYATLNLFRRLWQGVTEGFTAVITFFSGAFTWFGGSLGAFGDSFKHLFGALGRLVRVLGVVLAPVLRAFGWLAGGVLAVVAAGLALVVGAVADLIDTLLLFPMNLLLFSEETWGELLSAFAPALRAIRTGLATIWDWSRGQVFCDKVVSELPKAFLRAIAKTFKAIAGFFDHVFGTGPLYEAPGPGDVFVGAPAPERVIAQSIPSPSLALPDTTAAQVLPTAQPSQPVEAVRSVRALPTQDATVTPSAVEMRERTRTLVHREERFITRAPVTEPAPIAVAVHIDGETVARAVARAQQKQAARQFAPLRGY